MGELLLRYGGVGLLAFSYFVMLREKERELREQRAQFLSESRELVNIAIEISRTIVRESERQTELVGEIRDTLRAPKMERVSSPPSSDE